MQKAIRGYNQDNIQDMNRTLLLHILQKEKKCARITLANQSGLKQATVTNIINDFLEWKLVREVGFLPGNKGRRSIALEINKDNYLVAGIRIARRDYSVGVFNLMGEAVSVKRGSISSKEEVSQVFQRIMREMEEQIKAYPRRRVLSMGVAIPGPYSYREGRIQLMTSMEGWSKIHLREELQRRFSIPICIEQDANAAAMAQYWYRDDKTEPDVLVYIAVGQGVGAGIVSKGELLVGYNGTAGEIGHTCIDIHGPKCSCGNRGCLENYCSSIAFTRAVNEKLQPKKELHFQDAALMVKEENPEAAQLFFEACDYLAIGVVNVINTFNPQVVVIGDEMAHILPERMLDRIITRVKERVLPSIFKTTQIRMSMVEHDSMVHGAAIVAIRTIFERPEFYLVK